MKHRSTTKVIQHNTTEPIRKPPREKVQVYVAEINQRPVIAFLAESIIDAQRTKSMFASVIVELEHEGTAQFVWDGKNIDRVRLGTSAEREDFWDNSDPDGGSIVILDAESYPLPVGTRQFKADAVKVLVKPKSLGEE